MNKLMIFYLVLLTGCAHTIVDRDFEAEEREYIKKYGVAAAKDPLYAAPTADYILAAIADKVSVTLYKAVPDHKDGLALQTWKASIYNKNPNPVCVLVNWKLMDFEMITDRPGFIYLTENEHLYNYATMKQQIWDITGTRLVLPASGYVDSIIVADPVKHAKKGDECLFEDKITEQ